MNDRMIQTKNSKNIGIFFIPTLRKEQGRKERKREREREKESE